MSSTFNLTDNSTTFDLWNQEFALRASDGTFFVANTGDFGQLQGLATTTATVFATQLGASLILLIILLLITAPDKRRSLAFIFNALALVCNIIRCALFCAQVNGPFYNFMALELNDYQTPDIASAISESAACSLFSCFLFIFIELALILQIRVIYVAASGLRRALITYFSIVVALIAMGFRINLAVANVRNTIDVANASDEAFLQQQWAQRAANISAIVSIVLFSAIFCFKLAESIKSRRAMGLKQFGPIQIIFIMGCQTLLLPVIFAIIAYFALPGSQLQSFVETLVAIFLPLSSLWASANTNAKLKSSNAAGVLALPAHNFDNKSDLAFSSDALNEDRHSDTTPIKSRAHVNDLEMQRMSNTTTSDKHSILSSPLSLGQLR